MLGLELTGRVVDSAQIMDDATEKSLTAELAELEKETTDQLVVVTLPDLRGQTIEQTALTLGRGWGIGRADNDNGVLLLVAPKERKVRIEVGYGLEGVLTDARAATIVQQMLPKFRAGDMAGGVKVGTDEIRALLLSDRQRPRYRNEARKRAAA